MAEKINGQEFIARGRWIHEGLELEVYDIEKKGELAAKRGRRRVFCYAEIIKTVVGRIIMIIAEVHRTVTQSGIGLGSAIAVVLSWQRNKSILLAIIHGILSWIYVIYFALTRRENEE
ncbi:MAG: hypothetical protein ACYS76_05050 [Planctomycetota bacterium]|jgi:hypothetical protein